MPSSYKMNRRMNPILWKVGLELIPFLLFLTSLQCCSQPDALPLINRCNHSDTFAFGLPSECNQTGVSKKHKPNSTRAIVKNSVPC